MHFLVKADIQNWVTYSQNSAFLQTKFFFMCIDFIFLLQCPEFTIQLPYPFILLWMYIFLKMKVYFPFSLFMAPLGSILIDDWNLYSEYHEVAQQNTHDKN